MANTEAGKAIARLNAVRTGHRSLTVPLPSEVAEYETFSARMREAYPMQNPLAEELVQRACSLAWRLRRFRLWSDIRIEKRTADAIAKAFKEHREGFLWSAESAAAIEEATRQCEAILDRLAEPGEPPERLPDFIFAAFFRTFPNRETGPDTWEEFEPQDREAVKDRVQRFLAADRAFLLALPDVERAAWFSGLIPKGSELEDHERVGRLERDLHRQLLETLAAIREFV